MSRPTLFVSDPGPDPVGQRLELDGEGGHVRALRLRPGDPCRLTDGGGRLWRARLEDTGEPPVCRALERLEPPPVLPVELAFGVAAKDRTLWLVEKATELGVLALQPVEFRRSRSVADAGRSRAFWERAARRAVSALKQCGGARLPRFEPVRDLHDLLGRDRRAAPAGEVAATGPDVLLDREASIPLRDAVAGWAGHPPLRLLLGPEGGLDPEERAACRDAGFALASLGPRALRFETAAVSALAVAAQHAAAAGRAVSNETGTDRTGGRG